MPDGGRITAENIKRKGETKKEKAKSKSATRGALRWNTIEIWYLKSIDIFVNMFVAVMK